MSRRGPMPVTSPIFRPVKETVARIKTDFGAVHILVNNAGITRDGLAAMMKEEDFDRVLDVNLKGAFNMIRHCLRLFIRGREGCIINISSVSGMMGNAGQCNYSASKAGLIGLTKSIAKEYAAKGIRCNAMAPGFIHTDMTGSHEDNPLLSMIPLGKMGEPEDVADAVAYLVGGKIRNGRGAARGRRHRHVRRIRMNENIRRVVVTGLGAITPLGKNTEETWQALKSGTNGIAPITLFDTENYKAKLGAEVKGFNPLDYMEKSESLRTDRYTQFALVAAAEAVKESGVVGTVAPERMAVYIGVGIGGIRTFEIEHTKLMERGPRRVSSLFVPMMIPNMAAGMIAIQYDCRGPAMPAVTACASGSNAIGEAMRLIRHGYADAVITGGCGSGDLRILHRGLCKYAGAFHLGGSGSSVPSVRQAARRLCHRRGFGLAGAGGI